MSFLKSESSLRGALTSHVVRFIEKRNFISGLHSFYSDCNILLRGRCLKPSFDWLVGLLWQSSGGGGVHPIFLSLPLAELSTLF